MVRIINPLLFLLILALSSCGKKAEILYYEKDNKKNIPAEINKDRIYKF